VKIKAKNNINKNFNPLKQQKTNMGDLKTKMTQKNVTDKSNPQLQAIYDINEDEEDEEEGKSSVADRAVPTE